uniref:Uncharacterized protein n=1 Tax=Dunaliella tertiolecta TaxID=3047 RepID=A0A7S3QPJ8_DUNTE
MQDNDALITSHCHQPLNLAEALRALQSNEEAVRDAEQRLKQALAQQVHLCQVQRTLEHRQLLELVEQGVRKKWHLGYPVLAMLIHRCLLHWQALQHPDHAGQAMLEALARAISRHTDDSHLSSPTTQPHDLHSLSHFAYWLCVTSVTLSLLHALVPGSNHTHSAAGKGAVGFIVGLEDEPVKDSAAKQAMGQFKNKMASLGNMLKRSHLGGGPTPEPSSAEEGGSSQNGGARHGNSVDEKADSTRTSSMSSSQAGGVSSRRESSSAVGGDGGEAKRAKAPLVFLSQLDQLLLSCYSCIFDTFKKNLTQVLPDCIQAPPPTSPPGSSSPTSTPRHSEQQQAQAWQQLSQGQGQGLQSNQLHPPLSEPPPHARLEHQPQELEQQQLQQPQQEKDLESTGTGDGNHEDGRRPGQAQGQLPQQPCSPKVGSKQQQQQQQQQPRVGQRMLPQEPSPWCMGGPGRCAAGRHARVAGPTRPAHPHQMHLQADPGLHQRPAIQPAAAAAGVLLCQQCQVLVGRAKVAGCMDPGRGARVCCPRRLHAQAPVPGATPHTPGCGLPRLP